MRRPARRPGHHALTTGEDPAPLFTHCARLLAARDPAANALLPRLEQFQNFGPGWEEIGRALQPVQPDAAKIAFRRAASAYAAMEQHAPSSGIAYRLGLMLRQTGDLAAACGALKRATERDPGAAKAWFMLGLLRQDLSEPGNAITAFRAALMAQPDFHEAAFNLAIACQESGDLEAALTAYATAWRLRPDSFGRIAQALVSPATGRLWLHPSALKQELSARA